MPKKTGKNSEEFKDWKEKIALAKRSRDKAGMKGWKTNIQLFNNQKWPNAPTASKSDAIIINKMRSLVTFLRDSTYFREPQIEIESDPTDDQIEAIGTEGNIVSLEEQERLTEEMVNKLFRRLKVKRVGKKCILDGSLTPVGWAKVSHRSKTISAGPGKDQQTSERHVVERISPFNMLVDPEVDCFDMSLPGWLGEKKSFTTSQVKELYKDAEGKEVNLGDLKADSIAFTSEEEAKTLDPAARKKRERITVWEIHDRRGDALIEISLENGILRKVSPHPYPATKIDSLGFIYVPITMSDEDPEGFYPRPYVEAILPINNAINRLATYFQNHIGRSAKRLLTTPKGAYDDVNQLLTAADNTIVEHNVGPEYEVPVREVPTTAIPQDAWDFNQYLFGPVYREVSRIDEMALGGVSPGTSPTEAQLVRGSTQVGVDAKVDSVGDFLENIAALLITNAQAFTTRKEAIKIAGVNGAEWRAWTRKDIQGSFYVHVQAFSTQPFNPEAETRRMEQAIGLFYGKPEVDNVALLSAAAERLRLPSRIIRKGTRQGPQDPMEEHVMLIHGNPLRVDPTEDHQDHLARHEVMLGWLDAQMGQNPGNLDTPNQIQRLAAHIDQHKSMMVQIAQPVQEQNAQIGQNAPQPNAQPGQGLSPQQDLASLANLPFQ